MNSATLAAWMPAIITLAGVVFGAGAIHGRIGDQEKALKRHDDWLLAHDDQIESLEKTALESKAWREGYNAAKATHGPKQ